MPVTIIRPFNTFGPRQSPRAIIPTIILQSLEKNKTLELPAPEKLLSELRESLKTSVSSYTERIRNLSAESVNWGIKWMENLREEGGQNLSQTLTPKV